MFRELSLLALSSLPLAVAQVSNGFESGWDQTAWPIYAPDCNQGGAITLDSTIAHTGKNSLKVAGAGGYCGHIFFGTTQVPTGDVYIRSWVRASTALTADHVSFITMTDPGLGANKHLRFGGQNSIMMYNRETDDATLPDLSPQGVASSVALTPLTWQCLEHHIGADGTIETWLNGDAIAGLTVKAGVPNPNDAGWTRTAYKPDITGVYFGWESYGGAVNTFWYDDIAIASSRIGCAVAGSTAPAPVPTTTAKPPTSTVPAPISTVKPTTLTTSITSKPVATTTTTSAPAPSATCTVAKYGQCGGTGFTGCKVCASGSTCTANGVYFSQCV